MLLSLLLLLLSHPASAKDEPIGTISGAKGLAQESILAVGLAGGGAFLLAGPGNAYGPGLDLGVILDVPFGPASGFNLQFDHSLHPVVRSDALFEGLQGDLADDVVEGNQRYIGIDAGVRLGIALQDETRYRPGKVTALPWFRLAGGFAVVDTHLDVPSFEGRWRVHTRKPMVTLTPGLGVAVRLSRLITLEPAFKASVMMGIDHDELTNHDVVRAEWRLAPMLDVLFNI